MNQSPDFADRAVIKVLGVGGAGCRALNRMVEARIEGVDMIGADSDAESLRHCKAPLCIQLGETLALGLGAGGDSAKGRACTLQSQEALREGLRGADMVLVIAGLGGGTGTGGCSVVGRLARETGALTVGFVTKPFEFEGEFRSSIAEGGIHDMRQSVDALFVLPTQHLISTDTPHEQAFRLTDDVLRRAVQAISSTVNSPGMVVLDTGDLRAVLQGAAEAAVGVGESDDAERALEFAFEEIRFSQPAMAVAKSLIVGIARRKPAPGPAEVQKIMATIQRSVGADAHLRMGTVFEDSLGEAVRVTLIATNRVQPN